jgi:hypothetical protein
MSWLIKSAPAYMSPVWSEGSSSPRDAVAVRDAAWVDTELPIDFSRGEGGGRRKRGGEFCK